MISMELPAHATQHGALHLGVGVGINPNDPAGSALAAIHSHPQDPLALHHHNHGAATAGGMHEDCKKKRVFLLTNPLSFVSFVTFVATRDDRRDVNFSMSATLLSLSQSSLIGSRYRSLLHRETRDNRAWQSMYERARRGAYG